MAATRKSAHFVPCTLMIRDCCSAKIQPLTNWYRNISVLKGWAAEPGAKPQGSSIEEVRTNERERFLLQAQVISKRKNGVQRVQPSQRAEENKEKGHGRKERKKQNWNNRGEKRRVQFIGQSLSYYRYRIATCAFTTAFPPPSWTNVCTVLLWTDSGVKTGPAENRFLFALGYTAGAHIHTHTHTHTHTRARARAHTYTWHKHADRARFHMDLERSYPGVSYSPFRNLHPFTCTEHFLRQYRFKGDALS